MGIELDRRESRLVPEITLDREGNPVIRKYVTPRPSKSGKSEIIGQISLDLVVDGQKVIDRDTLDVMVELSADERQIEWEKLRSHKIGLGVATVFKSKRDGSYFCGSNMRYASSNGYRKFDLQPYSRSLSEYLKEHFVNAPEIGTPDRFTGEYDAPAPKAKPQKGSSKPKVSNSKITNLGSKPKDDASDAE